MKITESQLRQLVRTQLKNVLKEAEEQPVITFAQLKNADIKTKEERGTYQDSEGKRYQALSVFRNMSVPDTQKVSIIKSNLDSSYTAILNPDGDGNLQFVIEPKTAEKLNLEVKPKKSRPAGLPPKGPEMDAFRAQISNLKESIKKQIAKILKEAMNQQTSTLLRNLQFRAIDAPAGVTNLSQYNGNFNGPVKTTEPSTGKPRTFFAFVYNNTYYITMYYDSYKNAGEWDSSWGTIQKELKLTKNESLPVSFR